jgi:hypothetical protein
MNETLKLFVTGFVGAVTAFVMFVGVQAVADGNPATDTVPRLVHYTGTLERDGAAVNGTIAMTFRVYDGSTEVWSETQNVQVYAGRFSVLLGSTSAQKATALETAIDNADDLYLGITLATDAGDVALTNRQRFTPAPMALWTTAATNFKVAGQVNGGLTVSGSDNDGTVAILKLKNGDQTLLADGNEVDSNGTLYLNGNSKYGVIAGGDLRMRGTDFTIVPNDPAPRGDGGRALVQDTNEVLVVNYGADFAGGTRVASNLNVTGSVESGAATVNGNLTAHGTFSSDRMNCRSGCADVQRIEPPGTASWGYWRGWKFCPANFYVCGIEQKVEDSQGESDDTGMNGLAMLCCPF